MIASQERKALEAILDAWCRTDFALPGDVSYQDVINLCASVGVPVPAELVTMLDSHGSATTATPRSAATMSDAHMETADPLAKLASQPNGTIFMQAEEGRYKLPDGRVVYHGRNPVTFDNTREAKAVLMSRPWVIDHEDLRGRLWRVKGIECHCTFRIQAGRPIGVIVEPWSTQ